MPGKKTSGQRSVWLRLKLFGWIPYKFPGHFSAQRMFFFSLDFCDPSSFQRQFWKAILFFFRGFVLTALWKIATKIYNMNGSRWSENKVQIPNPTPNPNPNPNPELPYKSTGSNLNFVLEPWDHLQVHQDPSRHAPVKFCSEVTTRLACSSRRSAHKFARLSNEWMSECVCVCHWGFFRSPPRHCLT